MTLGKLLLLQEKPLDGDLASAGQLSALVNNTLADLGTPLAEPYDWSLLNMDPADGGNVLTTTLQKPGVMVDATQADGSIVSVLSDAQPWLLQIDGDHNWRQDSLIVSDLAYRVAPPASGTATAVASWTMNVTAGQPYNLQASWKSNVTQRIAGEPIQPASDAHYRVFDGANPTPIAEFTVDQHAAWQTKSPTARSPPPCWAASPRPLARCASSSTTWPTATCWPGPFAYSK